MSSTLLDPATQPKFVNAVPVPPVLDATGGGSWTLNIVEGEQWLGLVDPLTGLPLATTVWGYALPGSTVPIYPGPTIVAMSGATVSITWNNLLPLAGHRLPVDTTIHHAATLDPWLVPVVTHLHGGRSAPTSDGLPEAWWTQALAEVGADFAGNVFTYENAQESATLWYHDHALGITRLNVYMGLAGFYLLRDENEESLVERRMLPGREYEFGLAVQDRAFTADGQLYYPAKPGDPLPGGGEVETFLDPDTGTPIDPTVLPEFFGDHLLVNGMAWPKMDIDPGNYRFHLLNGSDSRFYWLELSDPRVRVWIVGSDGGLLDSAIQVMDGDGKQEDGERLIIAPGDRVDVVMDFSKVRGEDVTLLNHGPAFEPFKGLDPLTGGLPAGVEGARDTAANTATVGQVMQFRVNAQNLDRGNDHVQIESAVNGRLNPDFVRLTEADADNAADVRRLGLFEMMDEAGRMMPMLGLAEDQGAEAFGPRMWADPVTERIRLGDTEIWEIHNLTEDAHPVHLHLVQFQVLSRHASVAVDGDEDGEAEAVSLGAMLDVEPWRKGVQNLHAEDQGWQDTVWVGPGEAIRIIANFDRPGTYVWHCHILSHEDNEMMRPFTVYDPLIG
ncbi:multicopper oxidase family protein [Falsiroseomonas oryzae]|uniref:multicopper oxidase family protein n=1 Tax=Falsiroseomonas oryzae TaxID=2766473 RepID=UPI0022EB94FC|nr:multicopper oxidase domain-containing protein [Roseomonas sp. MO-31]